MDWRMYRVSGSPRAHEHVWNGAGLITMPHTGKELQQEENGEGAP